MTAPFRRTHTSLGRTYPRTTHVQDSPVLLAANSLGTINVRTWRRPLSLSDLSFCLSVCFIAWHGAKFGRQNGDKSNANAQTRGRTVCLSLSFSFPLSLYSYSVFPLPSSLSSSTFTQPMSGIFSDTGDALGVSTLPLHPIRHSWPAHSKSLCVRSHIVPPRMTHTVMLGLASGVGDSVFSLDVRGATDERG